VLVRAKRIIIRKPPFRHCWIFLQVSQLLFSRFQIYISLITVCTEPLIILTHLSV
jgi:hypothetical protein